MKSFLLTGAQKVVMIGLCLITLFGKTQSFNYHRYTVSDGLPSSQVYDIIQDRNMFIWVTTDRGVAKFDGYQFTHISSATKSPSGIPVFKLYRDIFDRIWFLSVNGQLSYYDGNKIVQYKYNEGLMRLDSLHAGNFICSFQVMKDSSVIIGTIANGAYKVLQNGKVERITRPGKNVGDVSVLDRNDSQVLCYNVNKTMNHNLPEFPGNQVSILENGKLIRSITTYNEHTNKIYSLLRKNGHVIYASHGYLFDCYAGGVYKQSVQNNLIISLYEDSDSCLWVGYYNGGVRKFLPNQSFADATGTLYFQQKQISKVMEDYEHGFWFATLHQGLFYVPMVKMENLLLNQNGDTEEKTIVMETDHKSKIFVGTNRSAVYTFCGTRVENITTIKWNNNENTGVVNCLYYDTLSQSLYAGTYNRTFQIKNGKQTGLPKSALCLVADRNGVIYESHYGLVFFYSKDNKIAYTNVSGLRAETMCFDDENVLWMGGPEGLFYYLDGKALSFDAPETKTRIQYLTFWNGRLYIGTNGGKLLEIDPRSGQKTVYIHPVEVESIYHLEPLNDSVFCISSSRGAVFYNVKSRHILQRLTHSQGLFSDEVKQTILLHDTLYILTNEGISFIRTSSITKNNISPKVYIVGCMVDSVNFIKQVNPELSYHNNYITFNFIGLSYRSLGKVHYRYRLLGYNDQWKSISVNSVQFPFLPPGSYTFEVYAINDDGIESSAPASFRFTVLAPFWKTAWFIALVVVGLLGVIVLFYTVRYRRLKERNNMLLQINDLRQKAMSLQMNPHFVFNSLNSIQSFVLREDSYKATKYLSRFARLIRMGLHHSNTPTVSLDEEITLLNLYLELEQMRFKNGFSYTISVEKGILPKSVLIPPMLVQPLVENCIKHGIDLENNHNAISVYFFKKGDLLMCRVEDNGRGINAARQAKQQNQEVEVHHSIGMNITIQRIRLFCEKEGHYFVFEAIDKQDQGLPETGTIVNFTVPYSK